MRIGVVGINHKLADLQLREQLAKTCQKRFGTINAVHEGQYFVLLSTCNRTEIYFSSQELSATHTYLLNILRSEVSEEFEHKLYSYFGIDCFSHLARVTSGLDSAIVAETEIQGQVKIAYEMASDYHALPKELHFLFQKSLNIAKKVRSTLQLGHGMPNLEHAILNTGYHFFSTPETAKILFVGASDINYKILCYLKNKNLPHLTLCNRSELTAQSIAKEQQIQLLSWERLDEWVDYDWIIFGTKSPEYLIKKDSLNRSLDREKLIMDLCVPRNVEPKLSKEAKITLLNIDQINRLLKIRKRCMNQSLTIAETMITASAHEHTRRYLEKERARLSIMAVTA
jgi:glutamyl-tRNA reductase